MHHEYTSEFLARFWAKIDRADDPDACWNWTAAFTKEGYGQMWRNGRYHVASRVSFELAYGPFPDDLKVCHTCDNPPCVNPRHLFLGTHLDNMRDMANKKRAAHHEGHGSHKLTEADVSNIRALLSQGAEQRAIARLYGVCDATVSNIKTGRYWR